MTVLCFNSEVTESRRIKSKGHWSHFGGTWMAQHLKMTLNVGFPLFVTHIILCEKLKAPIMRSLYKRSRWPHADVPQWPLVSPPPLSSLCAKFTVCTKPPSSGILSQKNQIRTRQLTLKMSKILYTTWSIPLISTIFTNFCFWRTQHFIHTFFRAVN